MSVWSPYQLFSSKSKFCLAILNQPFLHEEKIIDLWQKASYRVTVDGGTNHWYKLLRNNPQRDFPLPDLITGDFDSATAEVLDYFKNNKYSEIIETTNQDYTDFTKALIELKKQQKKQQYDSILVCIENTGRLDHIFANIETLFHAKDIVKEPVFLIGSDSLTWLLDPGKHEIRLSSFNPNLHCGLIPVGEPSPSVTTTGLKWNLLKQELAFGKLVSTSNGFKNNLVTVETSTPLLFFMEI